MAGFSYHPNTLGADAARSPFLALCQLSREAFAGFIDVAASTGLQSFTGVGFQPKAVIFLGAGGAFNGGSDFGFLNVGAATGASQMWALGSGTGYLGSGGRFSAHKNDKCICQTDRSAVQFEAELDSFDADGFTLDVTDAPGAVTRVAFLALGGSAFNYRAGTVLGAASTGLQAVTGLGFAPSAVLILSGQKAALGSEGNVTWSLGQGDGVEQACVWSRSTGTLSASRLDQDAILTFGTDGGVPALLSQAILDSLDADGFTLDWLTNDGTQRYFSYLAFDGEVESNSFEYEEDVVTSTKVVTFERTTLKPRVVLATDNSQLIGTEGTFVGGQQSGFSFGADNADDGDFDQFYASFQEVRSPPFGVQQSAFAFDGGTTFRSHGHQVGGASGNVPGHYVDIFTVDGDDDLVAGPISMLWREDDDRPGGPRTILHASDL